MARSTPLLNRSAATSKSKSLTATNEFLRRFRNTSRELPRSHLTEITDQYVIDLKRGGFPDNWIQEALRSAIRGYAKQVKRQVTGGTPINRPEHLGRQSRLVKKLTSKSSWFKRVPSEEEQTFRPGKIRAKLTTRTMTDHTKVKGKYIGPETVLFIPFTPESQLKHELQAIDKQIQGQVKHGSVKVVEGQGPKLIESLGNKAPWSDHCG